MVASAIQSERNSNVHSPALEVRDCGLLDYREALDMQRRLRQERAARQIPNTVLILEHPAVITLGARQSANKLLLGTDELASRGIDVVPIRRGGGATAHNPGQLVFYPILQLQELGLGVSEYVRSLETVGIELLEGLGVSTGRRRGYPGLWVGPRKIASVGVRVSRFVTHHGMAINIRNDLSLFEMMVPCGLDGVEMTSAQKETGKTFEMGSIKSRLTTLLKHHFSTGQR